MKKSLFIIVLLVSIISLTGCSGKAVHMKEASKDSVIQQPTAEQSLVVFTRTGSYGAIKQTSVFEIVNEEPKLVGILGVDKKVAYPTTPGKHMFMGVGSGLDSTLMSADLEAGKTYYVDIDIVGGVWGTADVILVPLSDEAEIKSKLDQCRLVELNEESNKWATENAEDIKNNYVAANEAWLDEDEEDRAKLTAKHGK